MTEQDQPEDEAVASTASNDAVDQDGIVLAEQLIAAEPVDLDETPNREAAKYRVRVRALETENVALAAQIEVLQRAQVGALVTGAGMKADAVWKTSELSSMLDEFGVVDPAKVSAAVQFARDTLGITRHDGLRHVPEGGNPSSPGGSSFTNAFAKPTRSTQ